MLGVEAEDVSPQRNRFRYAKGMPDANQAEIVRALRAVGCSVFSLAGVGGGCPDLLVGRGGATWLLEVKRDGGAVRASQENAVASWRGGPWVVVRSPDEALRAIGLLGPETDSQRAPGSPNAGRRGS